MLPEVGLCRIIRTGHTPWRVLHTTVIGRGERSFHIESSVRSTASWTRGDLGPGHVRRQSGCGSFRLLAAGRARTVSRVNKFRQNGTLSRTNTHRPVTCGGGKREGARCGA